MQIVHTPLAPAAIGPYSQAVKVNGMVFTSGQIALVPETGAVVEGGIKEQTTCFLADMADFAAFNEVYGSYFTGKPARSCVAVRTLPKNVLAEIEVIALCD